MSARDADLLVANLRDDSHDWRIRLLLTYGRTFVASPLPSDVKTMKAMCCYLNAYTLAATAPERFTYYEGYGSLVRANGWPLAHAWCVDQDDRVVDPTWWGISVPPAAYHGVPVPLEVVEPHAYEHSTGTFDWWLMNRRDVMEEELPRLLGFEPLRGRSHARAHRSGNLCGLDDVIAELSARPDDSDPSDSIVMVLNEGEPPSGQEDGSRKSLRRSEP